MKASNLVYAIVLAGAITSLVGCVPPAGTATDNANEPPKPLKVSPLLKFSDLPVPMGFRIQEGESWTYTAKGVRLAELHYVGTASVSKVVSFYEEQMPVSGWEKMLSVGSEDQMRLQFKHTRKPERCRITVKRRNRLTYITLELN